MRRTDASPGQRAGARPAALAERAERACEASGTTSKTGGAALDQSEGSCWWARQARFELRLRAAASAAARHTEPPGAWLPPRPEQTGVSAAPRHRRRLPLHPQIRALTKLALSCGFSRSSTHRAPWGVAPATPRTNLCVISSSCLQALASIDLWLWSVSSAEWWLEPLLDTPSASPLGRWLQPRPEPASRHRRRRPRRA